MADGFVVLQSYVDSINLLPEERRWPFFVELFNYRANGTEPQPQTDLERMALVNIFPVIDASVERYNSNKENGQKGGRPKKWVKKEEAEKLYSELKSWDKVADALGVGRETLRKARYLWNAQKPKNQDIYKDIDSDIDTDKDIDIKESIYKEINNKKERREPETLKGVPAPSPGMPGYEWVTRGVRYRITENREVETIGPA